MIDISILEKFGSTKERLREFFTCSLPATIPDNETQEQKDVRARITKDIARREEFLKRVRRRLQEHILYSIKNYNLYAAVDLAWDSSPINKATVPLLLYAQGKIKFENCVKQLTDLRCADSFIRKDDNGKPIEIDLPKFFDFSVNLVRSIILRRLAAQTNKYNNLWPYYKYEPRGTGMVSKLRADVLSQRVDIMVDQYDYRHHDAQVMRDTFLYGHSVDFPRASWELDKQWKKKDVAADLESDKFEVETIITKEGISWINPHPTRVYYDNAYPLASINSDTGCEYIGYWDVKRYGDVRYNPLYFNRDHIPFSGYLWSFYAQYQDYFNQYLNTVKPPSVPGAQQDPAGENDRMQNIGIYSGDMEDASIFYSEYFEKIIPKDLGIGEYPFPVWTRFTMVSDNTCIYAEFLPSSPAAYCGLNESDSRLINCSFAHDIMPFQDQLTNLATQMLLTVQSDLLKIIGVNTAMLSSDQVKYIRAMMQGKNYGTVPLVAEYDAEKLKELGINPGDVIKIYETRGSNILTEIFQAMAKLIELAERLLAMSPNEQGQPAPREISATEVTEIASTTQSVYSFISDAFDEFRAAKKRIVYESLMAMAQDRVQVPIVNRYPAHVIKAAGFDIVPDEQEGIPNSQQRHTVIGTKQALRHDYIFTSRDGAERAVNTQAANTLVQLLAQVVGLPNVLQAMGKEKFYDIVNEIFRLSGAGVDLNLELKPGEDNSFGQDQMQQLQEIVQQLAEAVKQDTAEMQMLKQQVPQLAEAVKQDAMSIQQIKAALQRILTPQTAQTVTA